MQVLSDLPELRIDVGAHDLDGVDAFPPQGNCCREAVTPSDQLVAIVRPVGGGDIGVIPNRNRVISPICFMEAARRLTSSLSRGRSGFAPAMIAGMSMRVISGSGFGAGFFIFTTLLTAWVSSRQGRALEPPLALVEEGIKVGAVCAAFCITARFYSPARWWVR